jgi:triosephosphate isomerase
MAMTVAESLTFVQELDALVGAVLDAVDVVICPPYTSLWSVAQGLQESRLELGGQNIASTSDLARTGEISAALLSDVGCRWVMLGHWEIRRHLGDDDALVNRKVHLAVASDVSPILLIGEARDETGTLQNTLGGRLARVLKDCQGNQVAGMAFVYEPEGAIGVSAPVSSEHVAAGCGAIRDWLRQRWGDSVADSVRVIYGGSVAPEHVAELLTAPDVDGLGASRRGRDARTFAEIVRRIAQSRPLAADGQQRQPT